MKHTYQISLPLEVVEELKAKYGFKLSEDLSIMVEDKLKQLKEQEAKPIGPKDDTPLWFNTITLATYKNILSNPDRYLSWLVESQGAYDKDKLLEYLKNKYDKEIASLDQ